MTQGTFLPSGDAAYKAASDSEIEQFKRDIEQGLKRGALGVGFGIQYTPVASRWEILEIFRVAARYNGVCYVHMRHAGDKEPGSSIQALEELIAAAAITGAPLHVVHISSSGLRATPRLLQMISEAQSRGIDVTTEVYPYTATQTLIESAIYNEGWQQLLGIDYKDLQWAATGERLNKESFEQIQENRRLGHRSLDSGRGSPTGRRKSVDDDRKRWLPAKRQRPPARIRHLRSRALAIRARAESLDPHGCFAQDDRHARAQVRAPRACDEEQRANSRRLGCRHRSL